MVPSLADRFDAVWSFTRGLTRDLLASLTEDELGFSPGHSLGPLWRQFRHLGRIQSCYQEAVANGAIRFGEPSVRCAGSSRFDLEGYLARLDRDLVGLVAGANWERSIDWGNETVDLFEHLRRMANHETLHHGQFIVYMRGLGKAFPESWAAFGL